MKQVLNGRHFTFQQDGASVHNAKKVQDLLSQMRSCYLAHQMQILWTILHGVFANMKAVIVNVRNMMSLDKDELIKAFSRCRTHIEQIISRNRDYF